ncbi:hypothetical protein YC2023_040584 [Brassica napus]
MILLPVLSWVSRLLLQLRKFRGGSLLASDKVVCDASASLVVRVSSSFSPPAPATQTIYESLEDEINLDNPVVSGFIPLSPAVNGTRKYSEVIHGSAMREDIYLVFPLF